MTTPITVLYIDNRETFVIGEFKKRYSGNLNIVLTNLSYGDFMITTTVGQSIARMIIIERKRDDDLVSSVKDSRSSNQKFELLRQNVFCDAELVYLIEEKSGYCIYDPKLYFGALANTIVRDHIPVIRSRDLDYTIYFIMSIFNSVSKYYLYTKYDAIEYHRGKNKLDKKNPFVSQLQAINGVSFHVAREVTTKYKCMKDLVNAFVAVGPHILADIVIKADNINNYSADRKIGQALSEKIYLNLCGS